MAFLIHLCVLFPSQHQKLMQFTTITTEYKFFFYKETTHRNWSWWQRISCDNTQIHVHCVHSLYASYIRTLIEQLTIIQKKKMMEWQNDDQTQQCFTMKASFFAESRDSILIKNDSTLGFILKYDLYDMIYECSFFFMQTQPLF